MNRHKFKFVEQRLGRDHFQKRLAAERRLEEGNAGKAKTTNPIAQISPTSLGISSTLRLLGLYGRGQKNAALLEVRHNIVRSLNIPHSLSGLSILHLSDLHIEISEAAMGVVKELIPTLKYDICVLTGDYRGLTFGPIKNTIEGLSAIVKTIRAPIFGVLGNHDSIHMLPGLEDLGIRILMNETELLELNNNRIHLAGIDDEHYFRAGSIEKVASNLPHDEFSILLSHTPEVYKQASQAQFNLMLSGHTHGGQICLPGGRPITLGSKNLPRRFGAGSWSYGTLQGYTSVGAGTSILPVRFNCPPEITLHQLESLDPG